MTVEFAYNCAAVKYFCTDGLNGLTLSDNDVLEFLTFIH